MARPRRNPRDPISPQEAVAMSQTPEAAVLKAQEAGEEVYETTDEQGQEFVQRPVSLDRGTPVPERKPGERIRVYNKRRSNVFCTDCIVGPEAEADILISDWETVPNLKNFFIRVA